MPIIGSLAGASSRGLGGLRTFVLPVSGDFESIMTVTVGPGGQNNIEFTSIPNTYTHLQIRYVARASAGDTGNSISFSTRLNGDTGSNYSQHRLFAAGTTNGVVPSSDGAGNSDAMYFGGWAGSGTSSNTFGTGVIDILDYKNTNKYKTIRGLGACSGESGSAGFTMFSSGNWRNNNAITSIQISGGTFFYAQHSKFALYGIKEKI